MTTDSTNNVPPNGADSQAPSQPKPWEFPSQEGLPTFWRPETVEATIKANQAALERQALEDADPPEVKLAREQRKKIEAHAQWEEHTVEVEKERTRRDELKLRITMSSAINFANRVPRDILRTAIARPFEFEDVPGPIAELAYYFSKATGFDQSGVIVAGVVAAGAMIHDGYKLSVEPKSGWEESARFWASLIGTPSTGKSPSIRAATDPIKAMHMADYFMWKQANEGADKADKPTPMPALYTSDATIAALSERLKDNERGILMLTEEFASWIGKIDATDRGEASSNRGHWLQLYDGGPHQFDRINRGAVFVPNWGASVLAACTPDGLADHMRNLPDDGLIHRFIPVIMSPRKPEENFDAKQALENWAAVLRYLRTLGPRFIEMSPQARELFKQETKHLQYIADALYETSPQLASHIGKHPGILARAALTFSGFTGRPIVDVDSMTFALRFTRRIRSHAAAMFDGILSTSPALILTRAIARSLAAEDTGLTTIGRQWMSDHCAEFKKADDRVRREAVQLLEDADWIECPVKERLYGGWPRAWNVHPNVRTLFGKEGEAWRQRRAAVLDAINGN